MVYSTKNVFFFIAFILSCGLAVGLSEWQENPSTQIPEIGINSLMLWGLPLIPTLVVQAGHHLTHKQYPDKIYIRLFFAFWTAFAFAQVLDKLY